MQETINAVLKLSARKIFNDFHTGKDRANIFSRLTLKIGWAGAADITLYKGHYQVNIEVRCSELCEKYLFNADYTEVNIKPYLKKVILVGRRELFPIPNQISGVEPD